MEHQKVLRPLLCVSLTLMISCNKGAENLVGSASSQDHVANPTSEAEANRSADAQVPDKLREGANHTDAHHRALRRINTWLPFPSLTTMSEKHCERQLMLWHLINFSQETARYF